MTLDPKHQKDRIPTEIFNLIEEYQIGILVPHLTHYVSAIIRKECHKSTFITLTRKSNATALEETRAWE